MIRVLVVDDNAFVRTSLVWLLESVEGVEVVGQCDDGALAVAAAADADPDVVLMDVEMPLTSGWEATRQLIAVRPAVRVLILTASTNATPQQAAAVGAVGCLPKNTTPERLVAAIRSAAAGGSTWPTA